MAVLWLFLALGLAPVLAQGRRSLLLLAGAVALILGGVWALLVAEMRDPDINSNFGQAIAAAFLTGGSLLLTTMTIARALGLRWQSLGGTRLQALWLDVGGLVAASAIAYFLVLVTP